MDGRLFARNLVVLMVLVVGPTAMTQANIPDPALKISQLPLPTNRLDSTPVSMSSSPIANSVRPAPKPPPHFSRTRFALLSTAVYAAAVADMHQTLQQRNIPWWHEADPLARPLIRLPAPAYYATGLVMATGLNWLSWKMAHSRRWHKLAPIPQLLAVGGNLNGFRSNVH
jgi:hypothetical protein